MSVNSLNSLQKKKRSEQMAEYVAGRNRVNVMPRQTGANYQQPISQGQARVAEIARQNRQKATGLPVAPQTPAEIVGYQQSQRQMSTHQIGGTVLTQEQILANNINDIIGQMNRIMSQPGQMLDASYSPYYSIYMEQYRENARKAEANAYARSVAGSGGYGSSYATMAGQQAYRDTMEGFTELTPSLVMTKGEAMSDLMQQYQMAKGLRDELKAEKSEVNDVTYAAYASIAESGAFNGSNESVIRARLENMKAANPDLDVNKVMEMLQKELSASSAVTVGEDGDVLPNEANVDAGYQYILEAMDKDENQDKTLDQIKNSIRASMKNAKYSDAEIDAAMEKYRSLENAAVMDMQETNRAMYEKALSDPAAFDVTTIGYSAEESAEMTAAEKKQAILDAAGEATKRGELAKTNYPLWMLEDAEQAMLNVKDGKPAEVAETLAGLVISFEDGVTAGYMTQQIAERYLKQIAEMAKDTELRERVSNQIETWYWEGVSDRYKLVKNSIHNETGLKGESLEALAKFMTKYWEDDLFK